MTLAELADHDLSEDDRHVVEAELAESECQDVDGAEVAFRAVIAASQFLGPPPRTSASATCCSTIAGSSTARRRPTTARRSQRLRSRQPPVPSIAALVALIDAL